MAVGDAVRRLREQQGWTQQKLADLTRFNQGTIANIEANKQGSHYFSAKSVW